VFEIRHPEEDPEKDEGPNTQNGNREHTIGRILDIWIKQVKIEQVRLHKNNR
jgi:hypothetical protein